MSDKSIEKARKKAQSHCARCGLPRDYRRHGLPQRRDMIRVALGEYLCEDCYAKEKPPPSS